MATQVISGLESPHEILDRGVGRGTGDRRRGRPRASFNRGGGTTASAKPPLTASSPSFNSSTRTHSWTSGMAAPRSCAARDGQPQRAGGNRLYGDTLKPGDRIVVTGSPARREANRMYIHRLTRPADGSAMNR